MSRCAARSDGVLSMRSVKRLNKRQPGRHLAVDLQRCTQLVEIAAENRERCLYRRTWRRRRPEGLPDRGGHALLTIEKQRLLRREVVVHGLFRHPAGGGDVGHLDLVEATLEKHLRRGVRDQPPHQPLLALAQSLDGQLRLADGGSFCHVAELSTSPGEKYGCIIFLVTVSYCPTGSRPKREDVALMLELAVVTDQLTKRFGDFTAVDRVDLQVSAGTVVSLLGPNGAGKTTIVRMLATLSEPTSGTAVVCGYDVARDADAVRRVISLTGQFAALEANLTAHENLVLVARLRGFGRSEAVRVTDRLVDRFDIGEFRDKLVKSISGGQRRRVDLAASVVTQPQLLVLDEPTTGLDPRSRQVVWSTIRELVSEGVTVLLTTQYLEEADALADSIVLIDHGRTVATGTPSALKAQIGEQRVDVVAADTASLERLVRVLGGFEMKVSSDRRTISIPAPLEAVDLSAVTACLVTAGVSVDEIALRRPTLDDAFLALTGQAPAAELSLDEPVAVNA